jgi:hypothetical protein
MIVHWWRNEQGTVVYEFSYLRSTIASDIHAFAGDQKKGERPQRAVRRRAYVTKWFGTHRSVGMYSILGPSATRAVS